MRVKRRAALYLDTWPFNGHSTVVEALWEGIPVLTLPHVRMAGRVGASVVRVSGVGQHLIARNEDDYIALAAALASVATVTAEEGGASRTAAASLLLQMREELVWRRGGASGGSGGGGGLLWSSGPGGGSRSALFDVDGWVDAFENGLRSLWDVHVALFSGGVHTEGLTTLHHDRQTQGRVGGPPSRFPHLVVI